MAKDPFSKLKDDDFYEVRLGHPIKIGGREIRPNIAGGNRIVLKGKHVKANAEAVVDAKPASEDAA
jgi:hypothetical protein